MILPLYLKRSYNRIMKTINVTRNCVFLLGIFLAGNMFAYEVPFYDKGSGGEEGKPNSMMKIDGVIWTAYEHNDKARSGTDDLQGPREQKSGFSVARAYINVSGSTTNGPNKGWGYRITLDAAPDAGNSDGCEADLNPSCRRENPLSNFVKFAFINIPVWNIVSLRVGQQGTPEVDSSAGHSVQGFWDYRALDSAGKIAFEEFGLANSTDRGIALIAKHDYWGAHILYSNGEGFRRNNAQDLDRASFENLTSSIGATGGLSSAGNAFANQLSLGNGDSFGSDVNGQVHFKPTGKGQNFEFAIALPFRLHNVAGQSGSENEFTRINCRDNGSPTSVANGVDLNARNLECSAGLEVWKSDAKAKRDYSYGAETNLAFRVGSGRIAIGFGGIRRVDRRGSVTRFDDRFSPNLTDYQSLGEYYFPGTGDQYGIGRFAFTHLKIGSFGAFGRILVGPAQTTSGLNTFSGRLGTVDQRSWFEQMLRADLAQDNVLGNLTPSSAEKTTDLGKAKFRNAVYGLTWFSSERFRLSFGASRLTGSDVDGRPSRVNTLQGIDVGLCQTTQTASPSCDSFGVPVSKRYSIATSTNASDILIGSRVFRDILLANGLSLEQVTFIQGRITTNDLIGRKRVDQQVFLRGEYLF